MTAVSWPCEELPYTGHGKQKEVSRNLVCTLLGSASSAVLPFRSCKGTGRRRLQCDQLVGTLTGGLALGSRVCVPKEFKEEEGQCGTVFLHQRSKTESRKQKLHKEGEGLASCLRGQGPLSLVLPRGGRRELNSRSSSRHATWYLPIR